MHKIIIDTDPGVDDAMAIAYAYAHPDIELLGLTTVFGNINIEYATRNAQYILEICGAHHVAVAQGADVPLEQPPRPHAEFVHGADGLGNCYPGSQTDQPSKVAASLTAHARHATIEPCDAADFIIRSAREQPGEVSVVAVGPLTNLALAYRREPNLPQLLKSLVIMGGTAVEPGNVSPVAEANFFNDPHAADELFAAEWPITVVGLDVTHRIMLLDSDLRRLADEAGPIGQLLWDSSRFYVDFYVSDGAARDIVAKGGERRCAMHDAAAVACLLMPDAYQTLSGAVRVQQEGMAVGQMMLDRTGSNFALPYWRDRPKAQVCMDVEAGRVKADFLTSIIKFATA